MTDPNATDAAKAAKPAPKKKPLNGALKFADDAFRVEQLLEHAPLFFEGVPTFLVEQALRADGKPVYTLPEAQGLVEQFTAPTPED
jgi:hypothetical protein